MRVPELSTPIGVILKTWPYAGHVLKRYGLDDLLWLSGTSLEAACKQVGADPAALAEEIAREGMEPPRARSNLVVGPGSEQEALEAAAAERARIEAEFQAEAARAAEEAEAEEAEAAAAPADAIPDVAALYRARPGEAAPPKPRPAPPKPARPQKQLSEAELAEAKARAEAKAKLEAELAASIPDVSSAFRAPPPAAPAPATEEEAPPEKGLQVPPKGSDSVLAKIMSWGAEPPT